MKLKFNLVMNELKYFVWKCYVQQRNKIGKMADLKNKWAKLNSNDSKLNSNEWIELNWIGNRWTGVKQIWDGVYEDLNLCARQKGTCLIHIWDFMRRIGKPLGFSFFFLRLEDTGKLFEISRCSRYRGGYGEFFREFKELEYF